MKLSDSCQFLTKIQKIPIYLALALMMLILPMQVHAQSCGGAVSAIVTPQEVLVPDLPEAVVITAVAAVGGLSANMVTDALSVGLTCADTGGGPGLTVPCANGDDEQDTSGVGTPIEFVSYIAPGGAMYPGEATIPACAVTGTTVTTGTEPNSMVDFDMVGQVLTTTGCMIKFNANVADIGSDTNPEILTEIFNVTGSCGPNTPGAAQGSLTIVLDDPECVPEVQLCVAVDTDDDGSYDDETCGSDMIGLNDTNLDPGKNFKYFVTGNKATLSEDLGACQVQQCIAFTGPVCDTWVDVTSEFALDSTTPGDLHMTTPDSCDADGDSQTFRIQCDTCDIFDIPRVTLPVDADVECADCSVRLEKQVSCDGGPAGGTWGESCTGWDGDNETWYRYTITNTNPDGSSNPNPVDLDYCQLTDVDAQVLVPETNFDEIGPIFPGDSATVVNWQNTICEDGEGSGVNGRALCACMPFQNGGALTIDDNVVGDNADGGNPGPGKTFGDPTNPPVSTESTDDTDPATLMCESAGMNVHKTCAPQNECGGTNDVTIVISNATADTTPVPYEADLTHCHITDALLTSTLACTYGAGTPIVNDDFTIMGSASSLTPGATVADGPVTCTGTVSGLSSATTNDVSVTCNVEDTPKTKTETSSDLCEIVPCEGCLTRTPGFWGTHPHITTQFLPLDVCGITINNVLDETPNSAIENMCSVGKDSKTYGTSNQQVQLERQCMAAALNIEASGVGGGSCSDFEGRFGECCGATGITDLCTSSASGGTISGSGCIDDLDFFNNSQDTIEWDSPPANPFISPGPADSSICRASKNNGYLNPMPRGPR